MLLITSRALEQLSRWIKYYKEINYAMILFSFSADFIENIFGQCMQLVAICRLCSHAEPRDAKKN